jgi:nucleotide-binding universal stress UspA family protein
MDHVLAAIDGSDNSTRALVFATELAAKFGATLHAVHVSDAQTEATEAVLDEARETVADTGVEADLELLEVSEMPVRSARGAAKELLNYASSEEIDHIVIGHHGAGRVERAMLGSASETTVREATVPVTVVP